MSEAATAGKSRGNLADHPTMPGLCGGTLKRGNTVGVGRPKKDYYTRAYERDARSVIPPTVKDALRVIGFRGKTWADAVSFGQHLSAAKGETSAAKELADRVEGKVALPLVGADGGALIPERESLAEEAARMLALVASRAK